MVTEQLAVEEVGPADEPSAVSASPPAPKRRGRRRRISKWDRPPDPHDWRFFVGTTGKILIAVGILLFGFVAYQLWGTGIEYAQSQNSLENEFEQLIAANDKDTADADDGSSVDAADDDSGVVTTEVAGDEIETDTADAATDPATDPATGPATDPGDSAGAAPDPDGSTDGSSDAPVVVEQDLPPVVRGSAIARLELPKIDVTTYVLPGVGVNDLQQGPGHYPDTPLPGQLGNASIAGHRTTWGEPFRNVHKLDPGDEMIVTNANGDTFVYDVTGTEIVQPEDYWVITTRNPNIAELTLTSCHPILSTSQRIAVHGILNAEKSADIGRATFYELEPEQDEPAVDESDDPVLDTTADAGATTDSGVIDATLPDADPAVTSGGDDPIGEQPGDVASDEATDEPAAGAPLPDEPPADEEAVADAFARGWFHDKDAFPQIALWGLVLTLISLGAYFVSRRFRHDSIGLLVGIAPFLTSLYFFFQNVNRLLPPGL